MTKLFQNKYRVDSHRLRGWDYAANGVYFITINTANRQHFFGHIENGNMVLNNFGTIAHVEWLKSFVAGYKSAVIQKIDDWIDNNNSVHPKFNKQNPFWQSNYYDHIIRDYSSYYRIAEYIKTNPQRWGKT